MKTRYKLAFVNVVIALGVGVIIWRVWPEAMKSHSFAVGYEDSFATSVFLAILMTGIPALLYAVLVHIALTHLLFKPDEVKLYRARQLVESIPKQTKKSASQLNADDIVN